MANYGAPSVLRITLLFAGAVGCSQIAVALADRVEWLAWVFVFGFGMLLMEGMHQAAERWD